MVFTENGRYFIGSHLTRGAWIEILGDTVTTVEQVCRTSHEVRGLKYITYGNRQLRGGRTSHEVRGLKYNS